MSAWSATSRNTGSIILFAALISGGVAALLYFWTQLLRPGELGGASLPLVALAAGVASAFNPCSMPALPGFLAASGSGTGNGSRKRLSLDSAAAAGGAVTIVLIFGIVVAALGSGSKEAVGPYTRWVQLAVGIFLIALAALHIGNKTSGLPGLNRVVHVGSRMWSTALSNPSLRGRYIFGAGYVAVGAG